MVNRSAAPLCCRKRLPRTGPLCTTSYPVRVNVCVCVCVRAHALVRTGTRRGLPICDHLSCCNHASDQRIRALHVDALERVHRTQRARVCERKVSEVGGGRG